MELQELKLNQSSYCYSMIELFADNHSLVYVSGFAKENDIRNSEWFIEYMKNKSCTEVEIYWYCTEGTMDKTSRFIDFDTLEKKVPTATELECLIANIGEFNFSLYGSCAFHMERELER